MGSSVRVFSAKENVWHEVSVYDYRENEDKHLVKYTNGDTEWICFKNKRYEVLGEHLSKKRKMSPVAKKSVTLQPSNASSEANDSNNGKGSPASMQSQGTVRRRSSRRSAQQKRKYVFSDSEDDDDDDSDSDTAMTDGRKNATPSSASKRAKTGNSKGKKSDDDDFTLSDLEDAENDSSDDDDVDGDIQAAKKALNDDDWIVDDDYEDDDEPVLKKRGSKKKKKKSAQNRVSSASRGSTSDSKRNSPPSSSTNKSSADVSLSYSRSSNLGKASILLRTTAAIGKCPDNAEGKQTYGMGEHWHDYQKWLYENRRDGRGRVPSDPEFDSRTLQMPANWAKTIGIGGGKLTPAQKQWWDFKRNNFDCIYFLKLESFTSSFTWMQTLV